MEKRYLAGAIIDHIKELDNNIDELKREIAYMEDLLKVLENHNKSTLDCRNNIEDLKTELETIEDVKSSFVDILDSYDLKIDDIDKCSKND